MNAIAFEKNYDIIKVLKMRRRRIMNKIGIIAQIFGILGMLFIVFSYQFKENKKFFAMQGAGSLMFLINYIMIGAVAAALFNLVNFARGILFSKNRKKMWKIVLLEVLYAGCFAFSVLLVKDNYFQIFLSSLPYLGIVFITVCMWNGNGKNIRISQIAYMSPAWLVHNIFNFTLGGIICETISIASSVVALVRYRNQSLIS